MGDVYMLAGGGRGRGCLLKCFYKSDVPLLLETLSGFLLLLLQNTDSFPWLAGPGPADLSSAATWVGLPLLKLTASHLPIPWNGPPMIPQGWLLLLSLP